MTEIRKVKYGSAVQFENLHQDDKKTVIEHIKESTIRIEKAFGPKAGEGELTGGSRHRMGKMGNTLVAFLQSIERNWWWPLTENERLGEKTTWSGYPTKEEALGIVEQASSARAKGARWAKGQYTKKDEQEQDRRFVEDMIEHGVSVIRNEALVALLETYLEESKALGTGQAGDMSYHDRRKNNKFYLAQLWSMAKQHTASGNCFSQTALNTMEEVVTKMTTVGGAEMGRGRMSDSQNVSVNKLLSYMNKNKCEGENKSNNEEAMLDLMGKILNKPITSNNPDEVFDRAPKPPEDMYDRRPKNPQVAKSWWDTLKIAGPVNTGNPGTKAMFNNKAINPPKKKPKKKKPKTYPIVPEEKDFWRD